MDIFRGSYIFLPTSTLIIPPLVIIPLLPTPSFTRSSSQMINLHFLLTLSPWTHSATAEPASQPGLISAWRNATTHRRLYKNELPSIWTLINLTQPPSSESKRYKWKIRKQYFRNSFLFLHVSQELGLQGEIFRNSVTGLVDVQVQVPACVFPHSEIRYVFYTIVA